MASGRRFLRSGKDHQTEVVEVVEVGVVDEVRLDEEDGIERKDVAGHDVIIDRDESGERRGDGYNRKEGNSDEGAETEEGPFVKVEYVRGRRTNGRNREELAKLRAIAVDRTMGFFLEIEDERGLAANQEEVGQKLNEHYTEILLKESSNDPNKKMSLKGLMLQRIKEMMELRGWRIVTL